MTEASYCLKCGTKLIDREVDGFSRRACPSGNCDYVFWDNPVPVVAAIIEYGGAVLLVRNHGWLEKMFGLVTGFLEKNESLEEGVLREVKEELGLEGEVLGFVGAYPFFAMNQLLLAFHVVASGEIVLGEELVEVKPVALEKLKPWPFGTGLAVRDWLANRRD